MSYYKARIKATKPFIIWDYVAKDLQELTEKGLFEDPLVVEKSFIPPLEFGVYNLKIVGGGLVSRSPAELETFENEYNLKLLLANQSATEKAVNGSFFTYATKDFPMDPGSRLFYSAIKELGGTQKLMTTSGEAFDLIDTGTNYTDFFTAYYTKMKTLTQPDV